MELLFGEKLRFDLFTRVTDRQTERRAIAYSALSYTYDKVWCRFTCGNKNSQNYFANTPHWAPCVQLWSRIGHLV